MTKEEAFDIINSLKNWNTEQKSISLSFTGVRTPADDIYDAKRKALKEAWETLGELP
jgi:hypothetical protein